MKAKRQTERRTGRHPVGHRPRRRGTPGQSNWPGIFLCWQPNQLQIHSIYLIKQISESFSWLVSPLDFWLSNQERAGRPARFIQEYLYNLGHILFFISLFIYFFFALIKLCLLVTVSATFLLSSISSPHPTPPVPISQSRSRLINPTWPPAEICWRNRAAARPRTETRIEKRKTNKKKKKYIYIYIKGKKIGRRKSERGVFQIDIVWRKNLATWSSVISWRHLTPPMAALSFPKWTRRVMFAEEIQPRPEIGWPLPNNRN